MKLQPDAIWLAIEPVDMRTGADGLSLHAYFGERAHPFRSIVPTCA